MRLRKARVQKYRGIRDSGWFDVESMKTILVGPNEAGKTVLLRALEQINPPDDVPKFNPLRDFPRSEFIDLKLYETSCGTSTPNEAELFKHYYTVPAEVGVINRRIKGSGELLS